MQGANRRGSSCPWCLYLDTNKCILPKCGWFCGRISLSGGRTDCFVGRIREGPRGERLEGLAGGRMAGGQWQMKSGVRSCRALVTGCGAGRASWVSWGLNQR